MALSSSAQALADAIKAEGMKFAIGTQWFALRAGGKTKWYIDCRPTTYGHPELVANAVMWALLQKFSEDLPEHDPWFKPRDLLGRPEYIVGGPAVGATSIAVATAMRLDWRSFTVRSEEKDHGASGKSLWVGAEAKAGDKVVLVEDVFTTGGSLNRAMGEVEQHYYKQEMPFTFEAIVILANRCAKSHPMYDATDIYGVPLISILHPADLDAPEDE